VPNQPDQRVRELVRSAIASQIVVCGSPYGQPPMVAARESAAHAALPVRAAMSGALDEIEAAANARNAQGAALGLAQLATAAGIDLAPAEIRPALFEDAFIPGRVFDFDEAQRDALAHDIAATLALATALQPGTSLERSRANLVERFTDAHGRGGRLENAGAFLSDYADHIEEAASSGAKGPDDIVFDQQAEAVVRAVLAMERQGEVAITAGEALALAPKGRARPRSTSQMCFLQPYEESSGAVRYAMNRCYAGAASTFSRFVPEAAWPLEPLRAYLREISEPGGPVEILGWFGFNACDHPDIIERKVAIPPIDAPGQGSESIASFGLRHRPEWDDLVFFDRSARDVTLTFTSVLAAVMMPRIHSIARLIGTHTESFSEAWVPFLRYATRGEGGIRRCPRVTIGSVTVVRRQLVAPPSALPDTGLGTPDYHAALNRQLDREEMPHWLYVTRSSHSGRCRNPKLAMLSAPWPGASIGGIATLRSMMSGWSHALNPNQPRISTGPPGSEISRR
jgi:hypothetical protein